MLRRQFWLILLIIFLAIISRFYLLDQVPAGMAWDEAAIGYNGWSIWHTYRDEWLTKLPISFRSFGDYKAPLAIYLNGLFTYLFGLNLWAVRFPFAISGVLGILGIIFWTKSYFYKIFDDKDWWWAIAAGFLMLTTPWHFHYSRAGFESGLSLTQTIWGFLFLDLSLKQKKPIFRWILSILGFSLLALTFYTYHSNKLTTPLLLLLWIILHRLEVRSKINNWLVGGFIFVLGLIPFLKDAIYGEGLTRAGVNIFSQLPILVAIKTFTYNFFIHLSPLFLVGGQTTTLRHGDGRFGVFLWPMFLLLIAGILFFIFNKSKGRKFIFIFGWIVIGILPACLGEEVPHSNRALQALPAFIILAVLGWRWIVNLLQNKYWKKKISYLIISVQILFFTFYLQNYFTNFALQSTSDFQYGYEEAFNLAEEFLSAGTDSPHGDKVVFSDAYGQPYIYALFYKAATPYAYHAGTLVNYEFKSKINIGDLSRSSTLVIASTDDDIPKDRADVVISKTDEFPRFYLYYLP